MKKSNLDSAQSSNLPGGDIGPVLAHDQFQLSEEEIQIREEEHVQRAENELKLFEAKVGSEAPALLQGRLPKEQESVLKKVFGEGVQYVLGVNQTMGIKQADEAGEFLNDQGGVPVSGYGDSFGAKFLLFDEAVAEEVGAYTARYLQGYYGQRLGRFVVAFPVSNTPLTDTTPYFYLTARRSQVVPEDFLHDSSTSEGHVDLVVDRAYVAGFIDGETQTYHPNSGFLAQNKTEF